MALLLAACTDENPLATVPTAPPSLVGAVACTVQVSSGSMECRPHVPETGASLLIVGGQDRYLQLANSNTLFDDNIDIFSTDVTVENFLSATIGTPDGVTTTGVSVFFASEPTNGVTVANASGEGSFTGANQDYFHYNQVIGTYEISTPLNWQFLVPEDVASFSFVVYMSADMVDDEVRVDRVWDGSESVAWELDGNWEGGAAPLTTSAVLIPKASMVVGSQPTLGADAEVSHIRVGEASTLTQGGFSLTVDGNVDATGEITGGTLIMTGTGARLRGTVGAVSVTGSTQLQGATRATGAVSVTGSLTVTDRAMTISIP